MRKAQLLLLLVALAVLAGAFLFGGPRGAVDWRDLRAVVLQSDDWGLAGFVPHAQAWDGLDRDALGPGRFPEVYWNSTLEDAAMVSELSTILGSVQDADGLPGLFQPNYVMGSLAWEPEAGRDAWVRRDLPDLPPGYERPGLWAAVAEATAEGTWHPEFHAAFHYDPEVRKRKALESDLAREVTRRGIMLFPGSEAARELAPSRSSEEKARELDRALAVFADLFGRPARSIMAPDYTWDATMEALWDRRGLRVIQGKREQRHPGAGYGAMDRIRKLLGRRADKVFRRDRVYLERNCRLEPVQAPDPAAVIESCLAETRRAWEAGRPAIVETHRVNFAHTDPGIVSTGQRALADYLAGLTQDPGALPRFLADPEVADLTLRGTAWALRGQTLVVRNATRSRKVVVVPAAAVARLQARAGNGENPGADWLVPVGPREVKKLDARGRLKGHQANR